MGGLFTESAQAYGARQLRAGSNPAAGMIVLDAANPYFTNVAHEAE